MNTVLARFNIIAGKASLHPRAHPKRSPELPHKLPPLCRIRPPLIAGIRGQRNFLLLWPDDCPHRERLDRAGHTVPELQAAHLVGAQCATLLAPESAPLRDRDLAAYLIQNYLFAARLIDQPSHLVLRWQITATPAARRAFFDHLQPIGLSYRMRQLFGAAPVVFVDREVAAALIGSNDARMIRRQDLTSRGLHRRL